MAHPNTKNYTIVYAPDFEKEVWQAKVDNYALQSLISLTNAQLGGIIVGFTSLILNPFLYWEVLNENGENVLRPLDDAADIERNFPGSYFLIGPEDIPVDTRYSLKISDETHGQLNTWDFDNLEFLQGILTACQWLNIDCNQQNIRLYDQNGNTLEFNFDVI